MRRPRRRLWPRCSGEMRPTTGELLSTPSTTFVYIKRQADVEVADKVKELKLDGVYFIADTRREYPNGSIGGQVIGYCNVDGEGITGLELQYNDILSWHAGPPTPRARRAGIPHSRRREGGDAGPSTARTSWSPSTSSCRTPWNRRSPRA